MTRPTPQAELENQYLSSFFSLKEIERKKAEIKKKRKENNSSDLCNSLNIKPQIP